MTLTKFLEKEWKWILAAIPILIGSVWAVACWYSSVESRLISSSNSLDKIQTTATSISSTMENVRADLSRVQGQIDLIKELITTNKKVSMRVDTPEKLQIIAEFFSDKKFIMTGSLAHARKYIETIKNETLRIPAAGLLIEKEAFKKAAGTAGYLEGTVSMEGK